MNYLLLKPNVDGDKVAILFLTERQYLSQIDDVSTGRAAMIEMPGKLTIKGKEQAKKFFKDEEYIEAILADYQTSWQGMTLSGNIGQIITSVEVSEIKCAAQNWDHIKTIAAADVINSLDAYILSDENEYALDIRIHTDAEKLAADKFMHPVELICIIAVKDVVSKVMRARKQLVR
jgi:hypothetical protein